MNCKKSASGTSSAVAARPGIASFIRAATLTARAAGRGRAGLTGPSTGASAGLGAGVVVAGAGAGGGAVGSMGSPVRRSNLEKGSLASGGFGFVSAGGFLPMPSGSSSGATGGVLGSTVLVLSGPAGLTGGFSGAGFSVPTFGVLAGSSVFFCHRTFRSCTRIRRCLRGIGFAAGVLVGVDCDDCVVLKERKGEGDDDEGEPHSEQDGDGEEQPGLPGAGAGPVAVRQGNHFGTGDGGSRLLGSRFFGGRAVRMSGLAIRCCATATPATPCPAPFAASAASPSAKREGLSFVGVLAGAMAVLVGLAVVLAGAELLAAGTVAFGAPLASRASTSLKSWFSPSVSWASAGRIGFWIDGAVSARRLAESPGLRLFGELDHHHAAALGALEQMPDRGLALHLEAGFASRASDGKWFHAVL